MKPFTDIVNSLRFGTLSEELTEHLHQLTLDCQDAQRRAGGAAGGTVAEPNVGT